MRTKLAETYATLAELPHEGLRDEADAWEAQGEKVVAGRALPIPDDGSGPMCGFLRLDEGTGMVAWGLTDDAEMSDWIEAGSLAELFNKYVAGVS